jgi:hypothetical protein
MARMLAINAIENMQGTIRRVGRSVKRWRHASLALQWAPAGTMEAQAGYRRLKAHWRALADHHPRIWKVRDEVRVASKRPCERPHVTSHLPDDDFLLRANSRHHLVRPTPPPVAFLRPSSSRLHRG